MDTKKIRECFRDRENCFFALWFLWMAVYYGVRMFTLTPWYDELYTYYYFIGRGPVYAALHWPLPNNHVGYSVLSGILDQLGDPYIGLRGVSYVSALASLILLYRIGRKHLKHGWSFCCVALYSGMNLVNQLAVQGRGYALAAACFLTALFMLQRIGFGEGTGTRAEVKDHAVFSLSLTLGLYVLPSSVYWVLPLCMIGGTFLLLYRKKRKLLHLIAASAIAAVNTVFLYTLIWLAIGSNLLSKTEGGVYYGQGHVSIILSAPFQSVKTGIGYMLATPYIQSVEREGYFAAFAVWLRSLLNYFYSRAGIVLAAVIAAGSVAAAVSGVKAYRADRMAAWSGKAHQADAAGPGGGEKQKQVFFSLLIAGMMILTPVVLVLQCKLPYFRVFSYMGIPLALLLAMLLQSAAEAVWKRLRTVTDFLSGHDGACLKILAAVSALFAIVLLLSKDYNNEYGVTEYYAKDALSHAGVTERERICVTDCYQQYLLRFCYGIECEDMQIEGADLVLIHREMEQQEPEVFRWEFYQNYESIPWEYLKGMEPVYENREYVVYVKQ